MIRMNEIFRSYIDGSWVPVNGSINLEVKDPGNLNNLVSKYQFATEEEVEKACQSAQREFRNWSNTSPYERANYIYNFIDLWKENMDEVAKLATKEVGKPIKESLSETQRAIAELRFWAGEAFRLGDRTYKSIRENTQVYTIRQPIGPIAAITPWNFPILTPLRKIIPALICGCTAILKPSIYGAGPSVLITQMLNNVGIPAGVFNLIIGSSSAIGDIIINSKEITGITFTGSTSTGLHIASEAAKRNVRVQLEMGGKNAALVVSCSNLENAAKEIVKAAFTTSGQRCTSISRVIVLEKEKEDLEEELVRFAENIKVGYGLDDKTEMGPVSNEEQFIKVKNYLEIARNGEGHIIAGGIINDEKGYYVYPTIITNVKPGSRLAVEEIFGPILVVIPVKDFEEAISVNNETQYGLTSAIFTDNINYAYLFSQRSKTGMVHINQGTSTQGHVPFGGWKKSGQGAFGTGDTYKDFFTILKAVYRKYIFSI